MEKYWRSFVAALVLILLQTIFIPFISVEAIVPDLLLIWVVFFGIRFGQVPATLAGFAAGLVQDLLVTQFFGLAAFAKTATGFLAGYFFNENRTGQTLGTYTFLIAIGATGLFHNLIYFGIFFQGTGELYLQNVFFFSLLSLLYTEVMSVFPMFYFYRQYGLAGKVV